MGSKPTMVLEKMQTLVLLYLYNTFEKEGLAFNFTGGSIKRRWKTKC